MDFASFMPIFNLLSKSLSAQQTPQPTQPVTSLSNEDREYIKKNTSMFPASFVPPNNFPKRRTADQISQPTSQSPRTVSQVSQASSSPPPQNQMDLNAILPLINSMTNNGVNTEQISKLMQGFNGGGDIGGLIKLISTLSKPAIKKNKQIINHKNDSFINNNFSVFCKRSTH